jgi:uncharacterized protein
LNTLDIILKYYRPGSKAYELLVVHSRLVADKAVEIAEKLNDRNSDAGFIAEAAMLHDIGIFLTDAPSLGCSGPHPYLRHGYLGARILRKEGLDRHALVCERHVGAGITREDVLAHQLPLPARDMLPITLEETIISYADKFYSKNGSMPPREKSLDQVVADLKSYGIQQMERFLEWHALLS